MMLKRKALRQGVPFAWSALSALMTVCSLSVQAAPGTLSQVPLFVTSSAEPNVMLVIDDSASMDFEVLLPSNDGALWWNTSQSTFVGVDDANGDPQVGQVNFNSSGDSNSTWQKYVYLFPNGTGVSEGRRVRQDSTNSWYAVPPLPQYAYLRSSNYNRAYYDPAVDYSPWPSTGTETWGDVSPTAAPAEPTETGGSDSAFNLTSAVESSSSNHTFRFQPGMVIPSGTRYHNGSNWVTAASNVAITSEQGRGISYVPATYYTHTNTGTYSVNNNSGTAVSGNCSSPDPTHYTYFHARPGSFSSSDGIDALGPDGGCLDKTVLTGSSSTLQNFANWFSYYRKRHQALRAGIGVAFDGVNNLRVGLFTINNRVDVTMRDSDTQSVVFFDDVYDIAGNAGGTPNRNALEYAGAQYARTDANAPIQYSCQKNFALQFTDGFSTLSNIPTVGNLDGSSGTPYEDTESDTLADIALKYYENKNNSGALGPIRTLDVSWPSENVPVPGGCNLANPDPALDCNAHLHMNTYTIGLNASGTIFNQTVNGVTYLSVDDAYATPPTWPDVNTTADPRQIDDLYHAAVNGRGEIYNADSPEELGDKLSEALLGIRGSIGSAAAVTFNTSQLTQGSQVYLGLFDSSLWTGDLQAYNLNNNGTIDTGLAWSAADQLDALADPETNRVILTFDGSDGVAFQWANLNATQQNDLRTNPSGGTDAEAVGQQRLDYIRGDDSNEGSLFRTRTSLLGDLVHSGAVFVGEPELDWPDSLEATAYSTFVSNNETRTKVLYIGANDGMLHGFLAEDTTGVGSAGDEVLAYIPESVYSTATDAGLHYLTDPDYDHRFYVDLEPVVSDAFIRTRSTDLSADWHTVLMGGLRAGGRGYFALDITDPTTFSEAGTNPEDIVMWEFTDADDSDLGYTFSPPTIAKMENGQWAAVFGNGYEDAGNSGQAQLFIVFLEGGLDGTWTLGTDYVKINTGVGTTGNRNGLSTPAVVDLDGDGLADRAYAGDLFGNMWAFDLSDASASNWEVDYQNGNTDTPLFTAEISNVAQPITVQPQIIKHPTQDDTNSNEPNTMVLFGTGQYLTSNDNTSTATQTFYAVWDEGSDELDRSNLVGQVFQSGFTDADGDPVRVLSDTAVDYTASGANREYGWYIDLPDAGERVIVNPVVRDKAVFFNTLIPDSDPCAYGGSGWLMAVSTENGGPPDGPVFDVDGNGSVNDADKVTDANGNAAVAVGTEVIRGIPAESAILGNYQYTPTSATTDGSGIEVRALIGIEGSLTGRLSWEELINE